MKTNILNKIKLCVALFAGLSTLVTHSQDLGSALHFDGVFDNVALDHFKRPDDCTVEFWVNANFSTIEDRQYILSWGEAEGAGVIVEGRHLKFLSTQGNVNDHTVIATDGVVVSDDNWHHVAIVTTKDTDADNVYVYVDGTLRTSKKFEILEEFYDTNFLRIGGLKIGSNEEIDIHYSFRGTLDELRIWNYKRSSSQIKQDMNKELVGDEGGLMAYFDFNEGIAASDNSAIATLENKAIVDANGDGVIDGDGKLGKLTRTLHYGGGVNVEQVGFTLGAAGTDASKSNFVEGINVNTDVGETFALDNIVYQFTIPNSTVTVVSYTGSGGAVNIPEIVLGHTVTAIGNSAFENKGLTSVTIPGSVTTIGEKAFQDNRDMERVEIPEGVIRIEAEAFWNNNKLTNVTLPSGLEAIGDNAFGSIEDLATVTVLATNSPDLGLSAFHNTGNVDLIVPRGLIVRQAYLDKGWVGFRSITDGDSNTALYFDGLNSNHVDVEHFETPEEFTIEFWMNAPAAKLSGYDDRRHVFNWWSSDNTAATEIVLEDGHVRYAAWGSGTGYRFVAASIADDNQWHHVAVVRELNGNPTSSTSDDNGYNVSIYIDGILRTTETANYNADDPTDRVAIGEWANGSGNRFLGTLDELIIWDYPRTLSQIQLNMNKELTSIEDGLVAYFKFDEGVAEADNTSITTLFNEVELNGVHHNGTFDAFTLTGTSSNFVQGVTESDHVDLVVDLDNDNALHFDGQDDFVSCDFTTTPEFTIEAWIKTTEDSRSMSLFTSGGLGSNFSIRDGFLFYGEGGSGYANTVVADGNWHHVAVTRKAESTDGNVKMYVDGVAVATHTFDKVVEGRSNIRLGNLDIDGGIWNFEGAMDEFRYWNYAKTTAEIQAQMRLKLSGNEANYGNLVAYYPFNQGDANGANPNETVLLDYSGNNDYGTLNNFTLNGTTSNWVDGINSASASEVGDTFTDSQDITYEVTTIAPNTVSYTGSGGAVNIPETIEGYTVTAIGNSAFEDKGLTSITIPNSVTTIGERAFHKNQLKHVVIPDGVTSIEFAAFQNNQLESLTIPNSMTSIGRGVFSVNQLKSIVLGNSLNWIDSSAFVVNPINTIQLLGNTPPDIHEIAFASRGREDIDVIVPKGNPLGSNKTAYENHADWKEFKSIREIGLVTVSINDVPTKVNSTDRFTVTIEFDENVTGFTADDIVVTNATTRNFTGSGSTYHIDITPTSICGNDITISVPENVVSDLSNVAVQITVATEDGIAPESIFCTIGYQRTGNYQCSRY